MLTAPAVKGELAGGFSFSFYSSKVLWKTETFWMKREKNSMDVQHKRRTIHLQPVIKYWACSTVWDFTSLCD